MDFWNFQIKINFGGTILGGLGPSALRCIWMHFDTFEHVWTHLDRVWTSVDRVWKSLEGVWRSLEEFDQVLN